MLAAMQAVAGPAWRWVDANGTVHYSDRPVPGAVEVYLPESTRAAPTPSAPPPAAAQPAAPEATQGEAEEAAFTGYTRLEIMSPEAEETLWNLGGELTVNVAVTPELRPAHRLLLLYDGEQAGISRSSSSGFTVTNVFRGTHSVQAVIIDAANTPVMRSQAVQFYVQQTSVQ